jgi:folate-binding protein YgfZ
MASIPGPRENPAYKIMTESAGYADMGPRTQIEMSGRDRAALLHGLCTNDIKRLVPGCGCEAFLTNVQGKVAGYVYVFCGEESLVLETSPGQAEKIIRGIERYIIREKVSMSDLSSDRPELLLAGPQAETRLSEHFQVDLPREMFSHRKVQLRDQAISIRRVPFLMPHSFLVSGEASCLTELRTEFDRTGIAPCDAETLESLRVESGTPLYGRDISEANLPQEVGRTDKAISFRKGCYLGQETVARLDAMGHVNRQLMGLKFPTANVPPAGAELKIEDKVAAHITSVAWSPRLQAPLALAYIRRGHCSPGSPLPSEYGTCEVLALPLPGSNAQVAVHCGGP